jgi:tetratricopeptide (TPR) repeat protein
LEFIPFTTTRNYTGQAISTLAANGLQQSNIGLKIDTTIGKDWNIISRLETRIDTIRGEIHNDCIFFNLGAMTSNKGIVHLLLSFAALADDFPQAHLAFKGLDSLYPSSRCIDEYKAVLSARQLERITPRIIYLGKTLTFAQTANLYQAADAYVAPYRAEGFNLPVLEAAACGLPVICTAGGPTDEFTDESFALRIPSQLVTAQIQGMPRAHELDPAERALETLMRKAIQDGQWREGCRITGPQFVRERFTWKHVADRLLDVLQNDQALAWRARPFPRQIEPRLKAMAAAEDSSETALKAYQAGDRAETERLCRQLLRREPLHAGALYLLGLIVMDAGRSADALLYFHQAATQAPETVSYHTALGEAYNALGRTDEAMESFQIALRLDPKLDVAHNALVQVLLEKGDIAGAIASFMPAIEARPQYARAHLNLGRAYHSQGNLASAQASYLEALRIDPKYAIAHNNLGAVFQAQSQSDEAIKHFRAALDLQSDYPEAHCNLGAVLLSQGDRDTATHHVREALRLRPQYARARSLLEQAMAR